MRRFLISAANIGPNRFHQNRTVRSTALRAVADIDTTVEQEIFYLSQGQRIADVHHHREADHLGRAFEITEGIAHRRRLRNAPPRLKPICSDNALVRFLKRKRTWDGSPHLVAL